MHKAALRHPSGTELSQFPGAYFLSQFADPDLLSHFLGRALGLGARSHRFFQRVARFALFRFFLYRELLSRLFLSLPLFSSFFLFQATILLPLTLFAID